LRRARAFLLRRRFTIDRVGAISPDGQSSGNDLNVCIEDVMTNARGSRLRRTIVSALSIATMFILCGVPAATAQQSFKSSEAAIEALIKAARDGDRKEILTVLGRDASDIVSSGDAVADAETLKQFIAAYDEKHELKAEGDSNAIMIIGHDDFPFPIPLVRRDGKWRFDTASGRREILYRRIGRNELDVIQTCLAYVDAQQEYADKDPTGSGKGIYAQRIVSTPGKKDGLYWPDSQGNGESPLGEFAAEASAQGYRVGGGRMPFHGYYYKILKQQGPAAAGGAMNYVVKGKMIGGFALVAYPATYRNSGVMTFVVNHAGVVYQKDLGPRSAEIAEKMTDFDPDETWKAVADATK
jgi:hypothetical protein